MLMHMGVLFVSQNLMQKEKYATSKNPPFLRQCGRKIKMFPFHLKKTKQQKDQTQNIKNPVWTLGA